jgi:hypothetical protein
MGFHEVPWNSMRFYDVLVNRSVPTEANRGLTSYNPTLTLPKVCAILTQPQLRAENPILIYQSKSDQVIESEV